MDNPPHHAVGRGRAVFTSHAHADARWLDRLLLNLKPLAFEDLISVATDRDIGLGDDWHAQIQANLNRAGAAVLLVSPAFLASEYIRNNELPVLLYRAKTQGLRIIPVILRPCLFAETRFKYPDPKTGPEEFSLASLQSAGSPAKALNEMTEGEQDRALLCVAQALERWVDRPNTAPSEGLGSAAASGMLEPLREFRARLAAGGTVPELDEETRQALLRHAPATVEEYRLARVAEWSPRVAGPPGADRASGRRAGGTVPRRQVNTARTPGASRARSARSLRQRPMPHPRHGLGRDLRPGRRHDPGPGGFRGRAGSTPTYPWPRMTMASIRNDRWVCTERKAARKASMCAVSKRRRGSRSATVKKYEPPEPCARR